MTTLKLILRNLLYFRAASLAVLAGMIVATAVLAGSLMVGDSVRGSLKDLAVQRLGPVDYALVANRFFDDSAQNGFAQRMAKSQASNGVFEFAPAVIANGSVSTGGTEKTRAGEVQVIGVGKWIDIKPGSAGINDELAAALRSPPGSTPLSFTFPSKEDAARDATVARRGIEEISANVTVAGFRLRQAGEAPHGMFDAFSLQGGQRTPRNAWLNLRELEDAVQQPERANVLLVHVNGGSEQADPDDRMLGKGLNNAVKDVIQLNDYGINRSASRATGDEIFSTKSTYLDPPTVKAAGDVGKTLGITPRLVAVNLVNRVVISDDKGSAAADAPALHYVIGAGMTPGDDLAIGPNQIAFNSETAKQLGAKVGDHIRLDYFRRDSGGQLIEVTSADKGMVFEVAKIIPMEGLGADASLTPSYKGLTDTNSVSDWRPPKDLQIDEKLAEKDNDAYWRKYKAAPRLFIHIDAARKLWGGPYGDVTSIRVPAAKAKAFADGLRGAIDPASLGFDFRPIRKQQLAASSGSTDFSGLFIGFSFFLIAAAALLVAMLFRLNIEQRVRQFGVLSAVGFSPKRLRRLALLEGSLLAFIGGVVGVGVGVAYTWLMVYGLRTWWKGAVGTTALTLHVEPLTLVYGFLCGFLVALAAVLWAVWRLGKVPPARLMSGQLSVAPRKIGREGRLPRLVGIVLAVLGIISLALVVVHVIKDPETALAGGAILLTAGLFYLGGVLRPRRHESAAGDAHSIAILGVRNANRHTARSVLSVGLIAFAAFTLITVASMQQHGAGDIGDKQGSAGGYRLIVQTGVPVLADLNNDAATTRPISAASSSATRAAEDGRVPSAGRAQAGFRKSDDGIWKDVGFMQLRRWAGQDISCLNLTQPTSPTILGVPRSLIEQKRFDFSDQLAKTDNPWTLLETPLKDGEAIPVVADHDTAAYILKIGLGETLSITDQLGRKRDLKLVATLNHTVFQSEMLMSDANFRELFPAQAGFGTLLVECPADKVVAVEAALNAELEPYAASIDTTNARLEGYQAIQNTYLSTFSALGALGLALGTIGLAVVLVRNVVERKGELALLSAIGFAAGDRTKLVLSENVLLLVLGLGVGTLCALLGITPTLLASKTGINWGSLGLTLAGVLVLGLAASIIAVRFSGASGSPRDLRSE